MLFIFHTIKYFFYKLVINIIINSDQKIIEITYEKNIRKMNCNMVYLTTTNLRFKHNNIL